MGGRGRRLRLQEQERRGRRRNAVEEQERFWDRARLSNTTTRDLLSDSRHAGTVPKHEGWLRQGGRQYVVFA